MIDEGSDIPGVTIRRVAALAAELPGSTPVGPYSCAKPGMLLRVVPAIGRFLARAGCSIDYAVDDGADDAAVEALLQGGVQGALIHQRGELPLHATTLVSPDRRVALALAGASGAGKSTTAFAMTALGWMILSDDLTRVTVDDRTALAWPGRARIRLLADACHRFGLEPGRLAPVPNWPGKYRVELPRWNAPVRLIGVVILARDAGPFAICRAPPVEAARHLAEQTYRLHYVPALGQIRRHLDLVGATAGLVAVALTSGSATPDAIARSIDRSFTANDRLRTTVR